MFAECVGASPVVERKGNAERMAQRTQTVINMVASREMN
jgi:hypothetical protein